jgi:hypothetical protein
MNIYTYYTENHPPLWVHVLHGVISAEELPDNRLTLLFSNGTAEWNSAGWWHTNGSGRWVTLDTRLTIALSNEAKLQGPAPTVTDCKYIGWERKFESKAPWTPSTFHRAILSLQDMLSVWSPLPGFLLKLPVTCQLTPSPWGSLASPGTHLAPVPRLHIILLHLHRGKSSNV